MFELHVFLPEKLLCFWSLGFAVLLSKVRFLHSQRPENIYVQLYYKKLLKVLSLLEIPKHAFCDFSYFFDITASIAILISNSSRRNLLCVYLSRKCPKGRGLASLSPTRLLFWNISDMTDLFLGKSKSTFASFFPNQLANKGPWQQKYRECHLSSIPAWKRCQKAKIYVCVRHIRVWQSVYGIQS